MKRVFSILLTLALVCCLLPTVAFAQETSGSCGDNVTWSLENGVLTISGTGAIENYSNDRFDPCYAPWYDSRSSITSVVIEDGVTVIGGCAFYNCNRIQSVTIAESVQGIGYSAFSDCAGLQEIQLPSNLSLIGEYAFYGCQKLGELVLPESMIAIGTGAFRDCSNLKTIVLPDRVSIVGDYVFTGCGKLESVTLSENISEIGTYAFMYCSKLASITIPAGVTKIAAGAFSQCSSLAEVHFEGDAPEFTDGEAGKQFSDVTATVCYPADNPTWTSDVMLSYGGNLTWTPSGSAAPEGIPSGTCGENLTWTLKDGVLTISGIGPMENYSVLRGIFAGWEKYNDQITSVIVEDGVTTIGNSAFYNCQLSSIVLPDSITSIGEDAFSMSGLQSITIPDGVTSIAPRTFYYSSIKSIVIPDTVTTIGAFAFNDCCLESVTIPGSVTRVGAWAFAQCFDLTEVIFQGDAPQMESSDEGDGFIALPFLVVTATAYYPAGNETWTEEAKASCGGNLTWVPYASADTEPVPGDISGDGTINDADVAQLLWYTLFPESYPISGDADFNNDGIVDDKDVAYLLWHTLFPESYPLS